MSYYPAVAAYLSVLPCASSLVLVYPAKSLAFNRGSNVQYRLMENFSRDGNGNGPSRGIRRLKIFVEGGVCYSRILCSFTGYDGRRVVCIEFHSTSLVTTDSQVVWGCMSLRGISHALQKYTVTTSPSGPPPQSNRLRSGVQGP